MLHEVPNLATYLASLANEAAKKARSTTENMSLYRGGGFPTRAGGGGGGLPGRSNGSPVEALALAPPDEVERDIMELQDSLRRAVLHMNTALSIMADYESNPFPAPGLPCRSCLRDRNYKALSDKRYWQQRLCGWCGRFVDQWGIEPPLSLVSARHDGHRITHRMIMAAFHRMDDAAVEGEEVSQE